MSKKFKDAFASARKSGKKEFTWNGKKYHTKLAEEMPKAKSKAKETPSNAPTPTPKPSPEKAKKVDTSKTMSPSKSKTLIGESPKSTETLKGKEVKKSWFGAGMLSDATGGTTLKKRK